MDRYYTVMIVPERDKAVRTIRIPRLIFKSLAFVFVVVTTLIGILAYDYWQILQEVYKNKHLTIENRQLKEQIQLFQMKVNSLSEDIKRVYTFEKKLRIITGVENIPQQQIPTQIEKENGDEIKNEDASSTTQIPTEKKQLPIDKKLELVNFENVQEQTSYKQLKLLYDQKIAESFGVSLDFAFTKDWNDLTKQSFALASEFALLDYKYNHLKTFISDLEVDIHELDQILLDRDSFLRSTPTIMPTNGWITSYYGPRHSPYSGRIKMHEGIDIGARNGTEILAPADGIVTFSGHKPGFGKFVQIDHGYGIETIYGHAQTVTVDTGVKIKRGHTIAKVGSTGLSTGPHVHYEVRINGTPVDPLYYILD